MANVRIDGLDRLIRKTDPKILNAPLNDLFNKAGEAFLNETRIDAPVDEGRLRSSLQRGGSEGIFRLDPSTPTLWVRVGTKVNNRGFPYPKALDESDRYHYRGGPKAGQPTAGWFSDAKDRFQSTLTGLVKNAERAIRAAWERG